MLKNFNLIMFNMMMMLGILVSLSSNNWMSMWLGMEISMMSFMPMMTSKMKLSSESCMKYYIIQSLSSSIMMMGIIMISLNLKFKMMLMLSILMKLGMVPFHNWMLSMIEGVSLDIMLMMFTMMKIAPMNMISYLNMNLQLLIIIGMIISSVSAINQNSVKSILTHSSIYNTTLMMTSIYTWSIWMTYMMLYTMSTFMMIKMCKMMNLSFINQIYINNSNLTNKIMMWIFMTSISGMPPMLTFTMKMIILEEMIMTKQYLLVMIMMTTSVITMYFYMRMSLMSMTFFSITPKWTLLKKKEIKIEYVMISTMMFPISCCLKSFY